MSESKFKDSNLNKKSKKGIIISIVIILLICIVSAVVAVVTSTNKDNNSKDKKKSVGTEWGDEYYVYLEENVHDIIKIIPEDEEFESINIKFIDNKENPLMLVEVGGEETTALRVCYIVDDKVESIDDIYSTDETSYSDIEYMYDIENESYDWYVHTQDKENEIYTTVNNYVYNPEETIKFSIEDTNSEDLLSISEFNQTFIKIENVKISTLEITDSEISKDEIFEKVSTSVSEYKTSEELITEDIEAETQEGLTDLENLKEKVEQEKQKFEEEARKKAEEEESSKGISVNGNLLKYGKYEGKEYSSNTVYTLIINSDKTFEMTLPWENGVQKGDVTIEYDEIYNEEHIVFGDVYWGVVSDDGSILSQTTIDFAYVEN